jgi:hypothetical protein
MSDEAEKGQMFSPFVTVSVTKKKKLWRHQQETTKAMLGGGIGSALMPDGNALGADAAKLHLLVN